MTATPVHGTFTREAPTSKREIELGKSPEQGGTISPADTTITVYGDTKVSVYKNTLIVNDKQYTPTATSPYVFDCWTINGKRIQPSHFMSATPDEIILLKFDDEIWQTGVEIKAVFVNENLKARAVYETNKTVEGKTVNTLTYYYDENLHEEGQVFEVKNKTGLDISSPDNITLETPSWIDSTFELDLKKLQKEGTGLNISSK